MIEDLVGLLGRPSVLVEREDLILAEADPRTLHHLHVQALSEVTWRGTDG